MSLPVYYSGHRNVYEGAQQFSAALLAAAHASTAALAFFTSRRNSTP